MDRPGEIVLEVLIVTHGEEGIRSVLAGCYPEVEGVSWLLSWQRSDGLDVPEALSSRKDFRVIRTDTIGVANNRINALENAHGPICLLSDDDLSYTDTALASLRDYWLSHHEIDFLSCHVTEDEKYFIPSRADSFDFDLEPKGYYFTAFEISFRLDAVRRAGVSFEPLLGVGAPELIAAEEEIFARTLLRKGLKGRRISLKLCDHKGLSTGHRLTKHPGFVKTQGAFVRFLKPHTWMARMPWSAYFVSRQTLGLHAYPRVLRLMYKGALYSRRNKMFEQ